MLVWSFQRNRFCKLETSNWKLTYAGWSSPVARQAHNLKVVGSNPTPATILMGEFKSDAAMTSPAVAGSGASVEKNTFFLTCARREPCQHQFDRVARGGLMVGRPRHQ